MRDEAMDCEPWFARLQRHNYWHGEAIHTGILRPTYLEQINAFSGNRLIKVLVGQRRTGKSYILRQWGDHQL